MKNDPQSGLRFVFVSAALLLVSAAPCAAQAGNVANSVHNLSASGPGKVKSLNEDEICKFCHIPHNAVVRQPLWGHKLSKVQNYTTPTIRRTNDRIETFPQPDGASRLCLSCHDGTIALGDVASEDKPIVMSGSQHLGAASSGYIGTDLSGSHPISFVITDPHDFDPESDMGMRTSSEITSDRTVRLDSAQKMQCTTCHDPHNDQYYSEGRIPHFWVRPTVEEVCLSCHVLR